ncbi:uncharacterized protein LOC126899246 isoform X2 [Daktulosphaira vitifoliae]|uniref:uncharacterized protein LOC126899246 isoform X2 n=1 Tax=Daktulosphaira vitifoliae TaxID=58002 RepID=UPI0021A9F8F9|nr:uncharacterized protein LOC126899246 isoform X2 [Daktulosphaira vitifoliae]
MEANNRLGKESPVTYSNGKRLFTVDQKVDALVRIKMTGCSKAEVARSLHVAESTFRGWFKNKDIVTKAEARYAELKQKSAAVAVCSSSDGYKSAADDDDDDNNKDHRDDDNRSDRSFSAESDKNSSTCYTDGGGEGSRSRFGSPDTCAAALPAPPTGSSGVGRNPDVHINNNNNNTNTATNNNISSSSNRLHVGGKHSDVVGKRLDIVGGKHSDVVGKRLDIVGSKRLDMVGVAAAARNALDLQHNTHLAAAAAAHHHIATLGLTGASAAAAVAAAAAAAAAAAEHPGLGLSPADLHSKINSYFSPAALSASRPPVSSDLFLTRPPYSAIDNSYNKSSSNSSFINTMVTATLMEPQALDLSMHSRNKRRNDCLSPPSRAPQSATQTSPKIVRHNFYRNLYKPYASRCLQEEKV